MSDLITVIQSDRSATVSTSVGSTGATVIKAIKGGDQPVLFQPKSRKRIVDYFGTPDVGNEAVADVISYNDKYPIWVSAPSTAGKYGGVLVTKTGTKSFIGGKNSKTIDFSEIENVETVETADGLKTEFTFVINDFANYINQSVDILVNGTTINVSASDAEPEILTTTPDIGAGTFTRATGALSFTFDTAPAQGDIISVSYNTDKSTTAYFAIFNKNAQADDLKIKITTATNSAGDFTINLYKKEFGSTTYSMIQGFPKVASVVENRKNGYQQNIYLPVLFEDSDYITVIVNENLDFSTFTEDTTQISFAGGTRGTTASAQLAVGWNYFQNTSTYAADIFFDTTADTTIPPIFETLRNSYQKRSFYIFPTTNVTSSAAITAMTGIIPDNKGLACYWGWAKVLNQYTGGTITSSLMGRRALRLADMYDVFNGLAPAWYNEDGTHGGQLGSGIVEMFYDATESEQTLLENARINPTIIHPVFGCVLTRERTCQSLQSDYSSIGHTRLADYLIKNILEDALPYQLFKLNDFTHRQRVKSQIEKIISPTAAEPYNLLRDYIVKCDDENNNDEVLAREEFVVSIAIKFTPFSHYITIYFINTEQGTEVSEAV